MEDQLIIEMFFSRSEEAINSVSGQYGHLCMSIARHILGSPEDAEECVNDAYLALWNSIPPTRPDSLPAYLCRIVRNISLMKYRKNTAEKRNSYYDASLDELAECLVGADDVQSTLEVRELTEAINSFLDKQKKLDRVLFVKKYWFCLETSEIADELGLSTNYVNVHLHRTRRRLQQHLEKGGYL